MAEYLGPLRPDDPLHAYLHSSVLPQLGHTGPAYFHVFTFGESRPVYLYVEAHSGIRIVGKFFAPAYQPATATQIRRMEKEFHHLHLLRGYGLDGDLHRVVRPLGCNGALSAVLIEEYTAGLSLSQVLNAAIRHRDRQALYGKLTALAYFLATVHNRTANGRGVDFGEDCAYLTKLTKQLSGLGFLGAGEAEEIAWLLDRWRAEGRMWEDQQVLVHGDATPTNFLFGHGLQVTAIDLERVKRADRVFDVGRIAGELQHAFLQGTGNKYAAEPFIGHFLWEYACHFPDRDRAFASIQGRVPFQMAITLLRIARNNWVSPWHRRRLIDEAKLTLRTL